MTDEVFLMNLITNSSLTKNAQDLRKNMTKEERHLWYDFLKTLPVTFHRQKVIGNFIVDFYCASAKIAIEIDGSQHYTDEGIKKDKERDRILNSLDIKVLRYTNTEINKNFSGVCADILSHLPTSSTAGGPPSPQGEG